MKRLSMIPPLKNAGFDKGPCKDCDDVWTDW